MDNLAESHSSSRALHGPLPDETPHSLQALHGPLVDENLPPPQALHGPLLDETPYPLQALHGPLVDENLPSSQALHGPLPDETPYSLQALHGPLVDENLPPPQALHGPLLDETPYPLQALHGPLVDENLPPPQALHGPLLDETPYPLQALHGPLVDENLPSSQALHGPLLDETSPPPLALYGPLLTENDPAWVSGATEEHIISRHSADNSFMSIFNWIRKRFDRKTHRSDSVGPDRRSATLPRYSRRSSRLNLLHKRDTEKGTSAATTTIDVQSSTTTTGSADATVTATPPSHTSADLKPGPDYAKMGSGSSSDPLLGQVTKVKDFIRQVHDLPWISTERVTIDYYPGQSKKRTPVQPRPLQTRGPRHVRSWYSERTSSLLPFTVVSPPEPHAALDHEVQVGDDHNAATSHPHAQQQLAAAHTSS